jgi:hypothetical protein
MFKKTLQVLFGVVLTIQLTGCFFEDRDHRHYDHPEHHDDPVVDVHLH